MIDIDSNQQLDAAVSSLMIAIENVKQQRSKEVKLWQKRCLDLQNQVNSLQSQLSEAVNINAQLQADMSGLSNECEKLRKLNTQLATQIKNKEQEIARYNQLNQNLRTILDGNAPIENKFLIPPQPVYISETQSQKDESKFFIPKANLSKPPTQNTPKKASASKSGQLLQKAKQQLSYSDFSLLIQEIQRHNNSNSSNAETLRKIKQILGPKNENLYTEFESIMGEY